jgi:hypothetical protein
MERVALRLLIPSHGRQSVVKTRRQVSCVPQGNSLYVVIELKGS